MDAPKTGAGGNPRDCRDGPRSADGAGTDPAGGLQSLPLETNQFSRPSRTTEPLATRLENVAGKFLSCYHGVASLESRAPPGTLTSLRDPCRGRRSTHV